MDSESTATETHHFNMKSSRKKANLKDTNIQIYNLQGKKMIEENV